MRFQSTAGALFGVFKPQTVAAFFVLVFCLTFAAAANAQPTLSKVFTPNVIGPGGVSTITFTITNGGASPVTGLVFTDTLPSVPGPMTIADPANASTDCDLGISGSLSAPDGGSTITLSDAQLGGPSSCTVTVDVTASTPGVHTNPAITLTFNEIAGDPPTSLPIDLTVDAALPGFSKSFAPSSVPLGGKSTLTFTINNMANESPVGNLDFTDNLPAGMEVADPSNASTDCISASAPDTTLTATPGTDVIILNADGFTLFPGFEVLPIGATCTVTVDVVATGVGMLDNVTNELLADSMSAGKASATLEVTVTALAIRKSFTDDPVPPGGIVTLEFVIENFDRNFSATANGVAFTDDLTSLVPALAGLTFDSLLSNDCGGSVTGAGGGTTIGFSGGTIAPESFCTIRVSLSVPAATPGSYTNTTGPVTATVDGSFVEGSTASDDLYVEPVPILTKEFLEDGTLLPDPVINSGDAVVLRFTITNTSATSAATDVAFDDNLSAVFDGLVPTGLPSVDPCSGATISSFVDVDDVFISVTGGSLAIAGTAGDSCTFDVTLATPAGAAPGLYLNTTEPPTATVDGATRIGVPASDTLTVIAAPQLTKSFTDDPVAPGGTVTLEFTLTHSPNSTTDATGITFTDNLTPVLAGLVATGLPLTEACDPDGPGGDLGTGTLSGSAGDTLLTFMAGTLSPGESCTFSVTLDVPAGAASGSYPNTTSGVAATVEGLSAVSPGSSDDLEIGGMLFTKEFLGDPAFPGEALTLRFTLENISAVTATDIGFTDSLFPVAGLVATDPALADDCGGTLTVFTIPGVGSFLTYAGGSLAAEAICNLDVEVTVPVTASDGVFQNFVSSVSYLLGATPGFDGPAIDDLIVDTNQLSLFKAFTDDPVAPGGTVTLEFTLTNLDPTDAASGVGFTDDLGAALTGLTFDSVLFDDCGGVVSGTGTDMIAVSGAAVAADSSCTIRVSLSVSSMAAAGVYPNTTSAVDGTIGGFAASGDPASDDLEVTQLLVFSKSFDGPTTATGTATLTFTITNPGGDTAIGIDFSDDLNSVIPGLIATSLPAVPCGAGSSISGISFLTFTGGELPPTGGMCSFDVEVLVPVTASAGIFPNTTSDLFQSGLLVADPATADLTIEPAPTFTKVFVPDAIFAGGTSTLRFTIDNSASGLAASSLAFTDNLPAGVLVATPAVTVNGCGGSLTATAGSGTISLSGGSVGSGTSCTVDVNVTSIVSGAHVNTTGDLTSTSGNSGTANDTLTVTLLPPAFAKVFAPDSIVAGDVSTLTFTIDNSEALVAASSLAFTDNLPAAVTVASPSGASTSCTGGTLTAASGTGVIAYTGGSVGAGSSCTVQVDVTGVTTGAHVNTTGDLTSTSGNSGTASDTLTITAPPAPTFAKVFAPDSIVAGDVSTLTFTIDNSEALVAATGLDFTDNLPAAVTIASPSGASTSCTGGTLTAASGTGVIAYTGGSVGAGSSCTVQVDVTGVTTEAHVNTTGDLTSTSGNSGTASDTLTITAPPAPTFVKVFAPDSIVAGNVSTLTFTIDNSASLVPADSLSFIDDLPAGVVIANPTNASTTCTGGMGDASPGAMTFTFSGGLVGAGAICTVEFDVTISMAGIYVNTTGDLTSSSGNSGTATSTLTVTLPPLVFGKAFVPDLIQPGFRSALTFLIDNSEGVSTATDLAFIDPLPVGVTVAISADVGTTCTGGTVTAIEGSGEIAFSGGELAPGEFCFVEADVTASIPGAYLNTSSDLTSSLGNSGPAIDTLVVVGAGGPCVAPDGENLLIERETFLGESEFVVCDTITVEPDVAVLGPAGHLILRAGVAVVLGEGFFIGTDGRLTVKIEPILIP